MLTLEQLEARIATLQEELAQTKEIASQHAVEHRDEGNDPYRQESATGHTHRTWAFFLVSGGR